MSSMSQFGIGCMLLCCHRSLGWTLRRLGTMLPRSCILLCACESSAAICMLQSSSTFLDISGIAAEFRLPIVACHIVHTHSLGTLVGRVSHVAL